MLTSRATIAKEAPIFELGVPIGRLRPLAFLDRGFVDCECLSCGKRFKRPVASLNEAKEKKRDSSCKSCRKPKRDDKMFSRRPPNVAA